MNDDIISCFGNRCDYYFSGQFSNLKFIICSISCCRYIDLEVIFQIFLKIIKWYGLAHVCGRAWWLKRLAINHGLNVQKFGPPDDSTMPRGSGKEDKNSRPTWLDLSCLPVFWIRLQIPSPLINFHIIGFTTCALPIGYFMSLYVSRSWLPLFPRVLHSRRTAVLSDQNVHSKSLTPLQNHIQRTLSKIDSLLALASSRFRSG